MMSHSDTESQAGSLPHGLLDLARAHTRGDVPQDVHVASRYRLLEAYSRRSPVSGGWRSAGPIAAGAVLVLAVTLGSGVALRRAPTEKDGVSIGAPSSSALTLGVQTDPSPPIPGADDVIRRLRPELRKCYADGLAKDPGIAGKVIIAAAVSANGDVTSASVVSNTGLPGPVAECLVQVVQRAKFAANGVARTLSIPIAFARK
jgi:hypothetical protein